MNDLLGATLVSKSGDVATGAALEGAKVVALYFSAHWCGPCRGFTPDLKRFYEAHGAAKALKVVFVSSDRDAAAFASYFGEDHGDWLALPYGDRGRKDALSKKYKVKGIPSLVLLDAATGALLTADGRSAVGAHPDGAGFPWVPPTAGDALAALPPLKGKKAPAPLSALDGPLLVYFSAHWCPPCRGFTPQLVEFFDDLKTKHPAANILFVSSDKDEASFESYFAEMGEQWFALPYAARAEKDALSKALNVAGIPALALFSAPDAAGGRTLITSDGRSRVAAGLVADFPDSWKDKPYADMATTVDCRGEDVNSTRALVVLADGGAGSSAAAVAALKAAAAADEAKGGPVETLYFFAEETSGPVQQVRSLCGLDGAKPLALLLLDIPDDGAFYYLETPTVDAAAIAAFLANPGDRKQLSK